MEKLLTAVQVSEILAISRQRVYQLKDAGFLPFVEIGGHYYYRESAVKEFAKTERKNGVRSIKLLTNVK